MTIYGAPRWADTTIRYDQRNNIVETYMGKIKKAGQATFYLESCGVESVACGIEAVNGEWTGTKYSWEGWGDRMFDFCNAPKNAEQLPGKSDAFPLNEIADNLSYCVSVFSTCFSQLHDFDDITLRSLLAGGSAAVLSYLTDYGSGHYVTVVAWNEEKRKYLVYDPWPGNRHCERGGVLEEYSPEFFKERARPQIIEIWK